jgi:hypothetical protein
VPSGDARVIRPARGETGAPLADIDLRLNGSLRSVDGPVRTIELKNLSAEDRATVRYTLEGDGVDLEIDLSRAFPRSIPN